MSTPKPYLVRLEYLTVKGWELGHAAMALLDPQRYVERLEANGKFGRATELVINETDDGYTDTGRVWVSPNVPDDPSILVKATNNHMPCLPTSKMAAAPACPFCEEAHAKPYDGSCLI